jgi:hypothetical protein
MKKYSTIGLALAALMAAAPLSADTFNNLFRVMSPRGDCQIRRPGQEAFEPVIKGKAYPFGSLLKCGKDDSQMVVAFSESDAVRILANSMVAAELDREADNRRIISLKHGDINVRLNVLNTNNSAIVETPVGSCVSMVGNARMSLASTPTENTLEIHAEAACQIRFAGPQFVIPELKNGTAISISTATDNSQTRIQDLMGDYRIFVNKGLELNPAPAESEEGEVLLPVAMSSQSTVKIWREKAPVGGRLIVSVLATGPDGKGRESYAFAVGRNNVVTRSNVFDLPALPEDETPAAAEATDDANLFAAPTDAVGGDDAAAAAPAAEAPAEKKEDSWDDLLM